MNKVQILRNVVVSDKCLLHGSPYKFEEIRPHYCDNEMAVCATPFAEIAVTMAILSSCGRGLLSYLATINNSTCKLKVQMCEQRLAVLLNTDVKAYVYAVDAIGFNKTSPFEYRVYDSIYSMRRISVTKEFLPFMPIEGQTEYNIPLNPLFATMFN